VNRGLFRVVALTLTLICTHAARAGYLAGGGPHPERIIYVATIKGVINPLSASYLSRVVSAAEQNHAEAIIVNLDTPGGLSSSMQAMTQTILNSEVPVIVYVSPLGARAASAGMYITLAAHIAAMAPATHIGAATPVSIGGGDEGSTMRHKLTEDAVATARSLAGERHRNADWPEQAVRKSVSISAQRALELKVIDLIAVDQRQLLREVNGRTVSTVNGPVTLHTIGAEPVPVPMGFVERLLHVITDPNIAYLLFLVGLIGIAAEFYHPGAFLPGVVGVICLALAFVAFDALPVSWVGVGLILVAIGLMVAEFHTHGFGALGIGAVVAFVFGSMLLYVPLAPVSPAMPAVRQSTWLIAAGTALFAAFFLFVIRKILQARRRPVVTGIEALVGKQGKALTDLTPKGTVAIDLEQWSAETDGETVSKGSEIEIVAVSGVVLKVKKKSG
jgi:membrane-bound serine protease (ClpP class)